MTGGVFLWNREAEIYFFAVGVRIERDLFLTVRANGEVELASDFEERLLGPEVMLRHGQDCWVVLDDVLPHGDDDL